LLLFALMNLLNIVRQALSKDRDKSYLNKYNLVIFAFVIWISFFDRYSFITQYKLSKNVHKLEERKADYERQLEEAIVERKTINSNIEKYGREKYYFHKPDEQIILIK